MSLTPQQRISWEEVEVLHEIGEGGFATVFQGRYKGELCAVKEMTSGEEEGAVSQEFWAEVEMHAALVSPFIVAFRGAVIETGRLAMVMELCGGGDCMMCLGEQRVVQRKISV
jgi:serine/threonine protein kinase